MLPNLIENGCARDTIPNTTNVEATHAANISKAGAFSIATPKSGNSDMHAVVRTNITTTAIAEQMSIVI